MGETAMRLGRVTERKARGSKSWGKRSPFGGRIMDNDASSGGCVAGASCAND